MLRSVLLNVFRYVVSMMTVIITLLLLTLAINENYGPTKAYAQSTATPLPLTPVIRFPVVPDAPVAGYFDHKDFTTNLIQHYTGRANPATNAGFAFTCANPSMNDWVGCTDNVNGEGNCPDSKELWYDEHFGTDFEYFPDWHTGSTCNVNLHPENSYDIPIFAAANGGVELIDISEYNGYFYRIKSNANNLGSSATDDVQIFYLHLRSGSGVIGPATAIFEGDFIGYGGQTGYASTPHLHLHVKRMINNEEVVVDPFGWSGSGNDPYPYRNQSLWSYRNYAPYTIQSCSSGCVITH